METNLPKWVLSHPFNGSKMITLEEIVVFYYPKLQVYNPKCTLARGYLVVSKNFKLQDEFLVTNVQISSRKGLQPGSRKTTIFF